MSPSTERFWQQPESNHQIVVNGEVLPLSHAASYLYASELTSGATGITLDNNVIEGTLFDATLISEDAPYVPIKTALYALAQKADHQTGIDWLTRADEEGNRPIDLLATGDWQQILEQIELATFST